MTCQGLAGLQEVPKSSRRPQADVSYVFLRVGEAEEADSCVFSRVGEAPEPQDSVLCVFLRVGEAKGTDSYVFSRAGEAPEGLAGAPGGPRMVFHTCFYVSGKPRKPNHTCFHVPERPRGLGRGLVGSGRAAGGPQEAPRGPRRGQEADLYVFLRVCLEVPGGYESHRPIGNWSKLGGGGVAAYSSKLLDPKELRT